MHRKLFLSLFLFLFGSFAMMAQTYLVSVTPLDTTSKIYINFFANGRAQFDVANYKVVYNTVDTDGSPAIASGLLCIPLANCNNLGLVSYAHGTVLRRNDVPSRNNFESTIGKVFASTGYIATMPDYLGLGDNPGIHPYLHAETQATASIDLIRAAREYLATNMPSINLNGEVMLTGYSQGGHAAMGTAKYIQDNNLLGEFNIIAAAPASGPYNLAGSQSDVFIQDLPYSNPGYVVYLMFGMNRAYGNIFTNPSDILKSPYDTLIPPFFNGSFEMDTVNKLLPANISGYLQDSVLQAFVADTVNQQHPIWQALNNNSNYDWTPTMPVRMYYCTADEQVAYQNALDAETAMTANGALDAKAQFKGMLNHGGCVTPSIAAASLFFDSLSTSCNVISLMETALAEMSVYPNPTNGLVYFTSNEDIDALSITIYNSNGQLVLSKLQQSEEALDISKLPQAMYFIEVRAKGSVQRMRILKQ
jgi:hypothetical protein